MKKIIVMLVALYLAGCSTVMLPVKVVAKTGELAVKGTVKTVGFVGKAVIPNGEETEDDGAKE